MKRTPQALSLCLVPWLLSTGCAATPEPERASAPRAAAAAEPRPPSERAVALEDIPHVEDVLGATFSREGIQSLFQAERLELHGILCEREPDPGEANLLGEYPIRSTLDLATPAARAEALGAFFAGVTSPGALAMCFEPHHAVVAPQPPPLRQVHTGMGRV